MWPCSALNRLSCLSQTLEIGLHVHDKEGAFRLPFFRGIFSINFIEGIVQCQHMFKRAHMSLIRVLH